MDHPPAPNTGTSLTRVDVDGIGPGKCSVKSCGRVPEDKAFKMCARCRDTQAKQAKKKRDRKREKNIKDGTILHPRAPIGVGFTSLFLLSYLLIIYSAEATVISNSRGRQSLHRTKLGAFGWRYVQVPSENPTVAARSYSQRYRKFKETPSRRAGASERFGGSRTCGSEDLSRKVVLSADSNRSQTALSKLFTSWENNWRTRPREKANEDSEERN